MKRQEDVIIPPSPSEQNKRSERGFVQSEDELPSFDDYNASGSDSHSGLDSQDVGHNNFVGHNNSFVTEEKEVSKDKKSGKITETTKKKETREDFVRLPHEIVHGLIKAACIVGLIIWIILIILLSALTNSNPFNTFIGMSPFLLTIIVTYVLVDRYHMESGFLMVFPFIFVGVFFMLGLSNNLGGIDYKTLSTVNIVLSLFFEMMITIYYGILKKEKRVKEVVVTEEKKTIRLDDEGLKVFVSNIEDKSKALNAAIGRVYSVKHGGTDPLRKKIKIDASNYNEFSDLKKESLDRRRRLAIELLRKIKDKLDLLLNYEKDVFDKNEIKHLTNIERVENGDERILDVLIRNDKDPVQSYYAGAVRFCDDALDILISEELEALKKKSDERKKKLEEQAKLSQTTVTKETMIK